MEAQGDPFRRGLPTLQASLTHPELPHKTPPLHERRFVSFFVVAGSCGEVFCVLGGRDFLQRAASHSFGRWGAFRGSALHECRDSACRRPFGVRQNAAGVCSEMTRRVWRFVRYNLFVAIVLCAAVAVQGSFWVWTGRCFFESAASHSFGRWGAFRGYALHECRDSACRRPFGVRLRGICRV